MIKQMQVMVKEYLTNFHAVSRQKEIFLPITGSQIRSYYLQGPSLIVKILPYPSVSVVHKSACISANTANKLLVRPLFLLVNL